MKAHLPPCGVVVFDTPGCHSAGCCSRFQQREGKEKSEHASTGIMPNNVLMTASHPFVFGQGIFSIQTFQFHALHDMWIQTPFKKKKEKEKKNFRSSKQIILKIHPITNRQHDRRVHSNPIHRRLQRRRTPQINLIALRIPLPPSPIHLHIVLRPRRRAE